MTFHFAPLFIIPEGLSSKRKKLKNFPVFPSGSKNSVHFEVSSVRLNDFKMNKSGHRQRADTLEIENGLH